jgi:hypothetical protein
MDLPSRPSVAGVDTRDVMAGFMPAIPMRENRGASRIGISGPEPVMTRKITYRSAFAVSANTLAIPPTPSISNKLTALMAGVAPSRI